MEMLATNPSLKSITSLSSDPNGIPFVEDSPSRVTGNDYFTAGLDSMYCRRPDTLEEQLFNRDILFPLLFASSAKDLALANFWDSVRAKLVFLIRSNLVAALVRLRLFIRRVRNLTT
jgi:hypothetical protein